MSGLVRQLTHPSRRMSLEDLAATWTTASVSARIPDYAALAHDTTLLRRIRGGLGQVFMQSASTEALAGNPCPWQPPCALDVFFREQSRVGAHGVPKPFVLAGSRIGADLRIKVTLFGAAIDWMPAVSHALVCTLRNGVAWRAQRPDIFLPKASVTNVSVSGQEGVRTVPDGGPAILEFLTPMNAEHDDPRDRPATVIARLARRVEGLARWHDIALDEDWNQLSAIWGAAEYDTHMLHPVTTPRRSGRKAQNFSMFAVDGSLAIGGLSPPLRALLAIGVSTHIGKGASEGFGHYQLTRSF